MSEFENIMNAISDALDKNLDAKQRILDQATDAADAIGNGTMGTALFEKLARDVVIAGAGNPTLPDSPNESEVTS